MHIAILLVPIQNVNNNNICFVNLSTRPDNVGNALITILEQGNTGETWIVEDNKPPRLVE